MAPPRSLTRNGRFSVICCALFWNVLASSASWRPMYWAWPVKRLVPDFVLIEMTAWPRPYSALKLFEMTRTSCRPSVLGTTEASL